MPEQSFPPARVHDQALFLNASTGTLEENVYNEESVAAVHSSTVTK
jgi:hypothetical protein